jgi:2-oxoglutarate ferredoxin oxidoreductase subunit delta
MSEEFNVKGYHPPRIKNEDECIYCRLCEAICPEFTLFVTLKEEEEEEGEKS